jgi:hypothetical protein
MLPDSGIILAYVIDWKGHLISISTDKYLVKTDIAHNEKQIAGMKG